MANGLLLQLCGVGLPEHLLKDMGASTLFRTVD